MTGGHSTLRNKRCALAGSGAESSLTPPGYHGSEYLGMEACPFTVRRQGSLGPSLTPLSTVSLTHRRDLIMLCTVQTEIASHLSLGVADAPALTPQFQPESFHLSFASFKFGNHALSDQKVNIILNHQGKLTQRDVSTCYSPDLFRAPFLIQAFSQSPLQQVSKVK